MPALKDGLRQLHILGALDRDGAITGMGRRMAALPLEPSLARSLLAAADTGCLPEALTVVAMLSAESIFAGNRCCFSSKVAVRDLSFFFCFQHVLHCCIMGGAHAASPCTGHKSQPPGFTHLQIHDAAADHACIRRDLCIFLLSDGNLSFTAACANINGSLCDRGPVQLVRGDEEPRGRQKSGSGGRGGQGGGLSEAGREILSGYMKEGLGDHILLLRLFQVGSICLQHWVCAAHEPVVIPWAHALGVALPAGRPLGRPPVRLMPVLVR